MAYDIDLANRLREATARETAITERAMFGGLSFLVAGNMAFRASDQHDLLVRVGPDRAAVLAHDPLSSPFVMNGREVAGWLRVRIDATATDGELSRWVDPALRYAKSLPPK